MIKIKKYCEAARATALFLCILAIFLSAVNTLAFSAQASFPASPAQEAQESPGSGPIAPTATASSYEELAAAIEEADSPACIIICGDITLAQCVFIPAGKDITLIDNGQKRVIASGNIKTMFQIAEGGSLTLKSSETGKLVVDGEGAAGQLNNAGRVIHCNGTLVLDGADICNAESVGNYSGIIYIAGQKARFEMKDGQIRNNIINGSSISSNNATIHATAGASVKISGGKISDNTAEDTSADRYVTAGLFARSKDGDVIIEMSGGEISNNTSRGKYSGGGGIWLCANNWTYGYQAYSVKMVMSGGAKIINNTADYGGGGVFVFGNASFTMNGGEISGNTVTNGMGGGIATYDYLKDTGQPDSYIDTWEQFVHTEFIMNGGIIADNAANRADSGFGGNDGGCGGGIYVASNNVRLHGGQIRNNTAARQGGGVYVSSTPYKLFIYDALVTKNSAGLLGGGMWLCPTGSAHSSVEHGSAIIDNSSDGAGDDIASLPKTGGVALSLANRMPGDWLVYWYEDGLIEENSGFLGMPVEGAQRYPGTRLLGGIISSSENLALKAVAAQEGKDIARERARLIIEENSAPRGGGIGTNGAVIFNKYPIEYPTVDVSVNKKWEQDDSSHPDSAIVYLKQDGKIIDKQILSAENNWTFIFRELPKYQDNALEQDADKIEIIYTISEEKADGYIGIITADKDDKYAFTILNKKETASNGSNTGDSSLINWIAFSGLLCLIPAAVLHAGKKRKYNARDIK